MKVVWLYSQYSICTLEAAQQKIYPENTVLHVLWGVVAPWPVFCVGFFNTKYNCKNPKAYHSPWDPLLLDTYQCFNQRNFDVVFCIVKSFTKIITYLKFCQHVSWIMNIICSTAKKKNIYLFPHLNVSRVFSLHFNICGNIFLCSSISKCYFFGPFCSISKWSP